MEPLSALRTTVELLEVGILDVRASVAHDEDQAEDEGALPHSESHWFDQIPSEPRHTEDGVVTQSELGCEEACEAVDAPEMTRFF